MTKQLFSSLGCDVPLNVPSTVDEFNSSAWATTPEDKRIGNPCLTEAINNIVYRTSLAEFRDLFLHGRDAVKDDQGNVKVPAVVGIDGMTFEYKDVNGQLVTGKIERTTKQIQLKSKDKSGNPEFREDWDESEATYFNRVLLLTGKKAEHFQDHANNIAALIEFDASQRERKSAGPRKLPKVYEEAAASIVEQGGFATAVSKIAKVLGKAIEPSGDKAKDIEALGWLIKEWKDSEAKKLATTLLS